MTSRRVGVALLGSVLGAIALAPSAQAAIPTAFGDALPCAAQAPTNYRLCSGIVNSFDGAPIDVKLLLPAEPGGGAADGGYPLAMGFHGWGGSKTDYNLERWVDKGYAAFTMSDRGWGMSCGGQDPKRLTPACTGVGPGASLGGYNHLMDTRFEVRDAQEMAGLLADDGIVDPDRIGATGGSYGGGISMALAALNDRKMLPDGSLVPWTSPGGKAMHIAAAAPEIPWTDLAYSLVPNGYTLDYVDDSPYDLGPIGVMKQSFVSGLYGVGMAISNYAPPTDASANVPGWYALLNAGEPYDANPLTQEIVDEVTKFHSSYYIDHSRPPAPLLISNGWTDDLFPADEAIRFYNRTRDQYPDADISLVFFDHGHQRGQNKAADAALLDARQEAWFDHYVKGGAAKPPNQVETLTQTCPKAAASGGPFTASSWLAIAPGEVRLKEAGAKTIAPAGGNPQSGQAFDPIAGPGACATASATDAPGLANYRLDPAPSGGFTLMGSPTVVADVVSQGPTSQIASRLVDVDPETGNETLVARGLYRPKPTGATAKRVVFQLHAERLPVQEGARREARADAQRRPLRARVQWPGVRSRSRTSTCGCRCSRRPKHPGRHRAGAEVRAARLRSGQRAAPERDRLRRRRRRRPGRPLRQPARPGVEPGLPAGEERRLRDGPARDERQGQAEGHLAWRASARPQGLRPDQRQGRRGLPGRQRRSRPAQRRFRQGQDQSGRRPRSRLRPRRRARHHQLRLRSRPGEGRRQGQGAEELRAGHGEPLVEVGGASR